MRARSTAASVCPARTSTPPVRARSGNMWPGRARSAGRVAGSIAASTVAARSAAEMPVRRTCAWLRSARRTPCSNARACSALTISGMSSSSSRSGVIDRQIRPRPYLAMKLIASGVTFSAAIVRSPSFSRSSSSTTMIIRPSRKAVDGVFDAARTATASGRPWHLYRCHELHALFPCVSPADAVPASSRAQHVLADHVAFEIDRGRCTLRGLRFVCCHVNGMTCTSKRSSSTPGDRQADAVDRDRSLAHDHAAPATAGSCTVSHQQSPSCRSLLDRADRVDVPLHEVAAERARRRAAAARGSRGCRASASRASSPAAFRAPTSACTPSRSAETTVRQTPLTASAVARRQLRRERRCRCAGGSPPVVGLHLDDLADRFNESREHSLPSARPAPSQRRRGARRSVRRRDSRPAASSGTPPGPSTRGVM